jgi:ribosome-interacting GTPase 1
VIILGKRVVVVFLIKAFVLLVNMSSAFRLARGEHNVVISCEMKLNLDYLVESLWEHLDLIR